MTTSLLLLSALLAASSGGVVVARRAQGKRRDQVVAKVQDPGSSGLEAIGELLPCAVAEHDAFERTHHVRFDWHQRRHAVRHRLERLLHAAGHRCTADAVRAAVDKEIPRPPPGEKG